MIWRTSASPFVLKKSTKDGRNSDALGSTVVNRNIAAFNTADSIHVNAPIAIKK